jgi:hypothetical protein
MHQFRRTQSLTRGNGAVTDYGYDAVSRLQTLTQKPSSASYDQTVTLAYNPVSQIFSRTGTNTAYAWTGHGSGSTPSVADGLNRLSSIGGGAAAYDARGNLTSDPTTGKSYTYWPSDNALWTASPPWSALSYDPLGRLALIDSASDTAFAYDGLDMIAEYDGAGTMLARYVHGPGPSAGSGQAIDQPLVRYDDDENQRHLGNGAFSSWHQQQAVAPRRRARQHHRFVLWGALCPDDQPLRRIWHAPGGQHRAVPVHRADVAERGRRLPLQGPRLLADVRRPVPADRSDWVCEWDQSLFLRGE